MDRDPGFTEIKRQTLADGVYEQVRSLIMNGELAHGIELKQAELAKQLGVSRVPVREALRRLQAERLVTGNPFQRYVVTTLSPEQLMELVDIREELEVFALRRALRSGVGPVYLAAARSAADRLKVDVAPDQWLMADREFHAILNGENSAASLLIEDIRQRIHRYLHFAVSGEPRRRQILHEHEALLLAMGQGSGDDAEEAIRTHVRGPRDTLQAYVNRLREETNSPRSKPAR